MDRKISGNRYEFTVLLERSNKNFCFEVLSKYKPTGQKSTITNVNFIISELVFPIIETTDVETSVFLNRRRGMKLFRETISSFKNDSWVQLLEEKLDEDRGYGGWNSNRET
ncbi:MAG TPA: hypothetical protein PK397_04175 [Ignavibacteriaceae bacterium]|nr:hypothetical protein [Ignavibacteriaceae bacterium]